MAELIDKGALMEKLNVFNDRVHGNEHFLYGIETAKELLEDTPTVTEVEIRAKAQRDIVEWFWMRRFSFISAQDILDKYAEQLKGE